MSAGFTSGPWQIAGARHSGDLKIGRDARLHFVGPDGDAVAAVFFDMKTGRGWKDAHLIAAAPALYALAERAMHWFADNQCAGDLAWEIGEVLAKARGDLVDPLEQGRP